MNTTHTPGPWSHTPGQEAIWAHDGSLLIARTDYTRHDMAVNEDEANARLIASAPCLLAALKDCLSFMEEVAGEHGIADTKSENAARAAISAAIK